MDNKKKKALKKEEREKNEKSFVAIVKEASLLRDQDREFHGLEREFMYLQQGLLEAFRQSGNLKHPRDIGHAREDHLRGFLSTSGYIPFRIGVTTTSARVVSPSGHTSKELDIVFYDKINSSILMARGNSFEAYPIECTHGIIQVKSMLVKTEIQSGLDNISSYKSLYADPRTGYRSGFGILFAYDSEMEWVDIVKEVEIFAMANEKHLWCNVVVILNRGLIFHGKSGMIAIKNEDIAEIDDLQMHGDPDRWGTCLFSLYTIIMDFCSNTTAGSAGINSYYRLPLISGPYSYEYIAGALLEMEECPTHGKFQKKISEDNLNRIVGSIKNSKTIESSDVFDLAFGKEPPQRDYIQNPIKVYNPDLLDYALVFRPEGGTGINTEMIRIATTTVWLPRYYVNKESLIEPCPACKRTDAQKEKRKAKAEVAKLKKAKTKI